MQVRVTEGQPLSRLSFSLREVLTNLRYQLRCGQVALPRTPRELGFLILIQNRELGFLKLIQNGLVLDVLGDMVEGIVKGSFGDGDFLVLAQNSIGFLK